MQHRLKKSKCYIQFEILILWIEIEWLRIELENNIELRLGEGSTSKSLKSLIIYQLVSNLLS